MSGFEIGTLLIAIWGAVLSTVLGVYKVFIADKRNVKVFLEAGFIPHRGGGHINTINVRFYNHGRRSISITSYGIKLSDGHHMPLYRLEIPEALPRTFSDGQGCSFIGNRSRIETSIRNHGITSITKIQGYVQDISGKRHLSKKLKINIP